MKRKNKEIANDEIKIPLHEMRDTLHELREKNMKIKSRLRLNTWIYIIVILLIAISVTWSFWDLDRVGRNEELVLKMQKNAFERASLRDDYLLHGEERANIQWLAKSETLSGLLRIAHDRFTTAEDKDILQEVQQCFDRTFSVFSEVVEKQKKEGRSANRELYRDEAKSRMISQVFLSSYNLMDNIGRLRESAERKVTSSIHIASLVIVFFFAGGGLVIIINSTSLSRTLAKRLVLLADGIKIIGDGNLEHQIITTGNDELTDLVSAINKMAVQLKQSHTSMATLRTEIELRNQAEVATRVSEQKYHLLFDEMMSGCAVHEIICDENGKPVDYRFLSVNAAFEKMTALNSADIIGRTVLEVLPNTESFWIERYGQVALTREPAFFENYAAEHSKYYEVRVFSPSPGVFATIFNEITERKRVEEETIKLHGELEQHVAERTADLTVRTAELERINKVFVDRELRMRELKARIAELEKLIS